MQEPAVVPFCFESNEVRVVKQDLEPWFVAADVCRILEHTNPTTALSMLDEDEKAKKSLGLPGGETNIISESGLYTLVIRSNKPQAKPFRRWVTHEVLPAIRRTGHYDFRSERTVSVQQTHLRTTAAPNGLDIQYRLDLTKVISRPTREGLEVLERLTGISFADIDLVGDGLTTMVSKFLAEQFVQDDTARVSLKEVHGRFCRWYVRRRDGLAPTNKALAAELRRQGLRCEKLGGGYWVYGITAAVREVRS